MNLKICKVQPIKEISGLPVFEKAQELTPQTANINIDNWNEVLYVHHKNKEAGTGAREIYGVSIYICINDSEIEPILLNKALFNYFNNIFGEDNLLSIKAERAQGDYHYYILHYPLRGRALNPEGWYLIKDEKYELKEDIIQGFLSFLEDTFGKEIKCEDDILQVIKKQKAPVAQIDLISDLDFSFTGNEKKEYIYDAAGYDKQESLDMEYTKFIQLSQHTIRYFTTGTEKDLYQQVQQGSVSRDNFLKEVNRFVMRTYPDISERDNTVLLNKVAAAVFGNYVLDALINADDISDIKVIDPSHIRVKCNGKRMTSNVSFLDGHDYIRFINSLAIRNGLDLCGESIHVFTDTTTSPDFILRFNIAMPYINSSPFPYLHIRKIRKNKLYLDDLIKLQCMPRKVADYLKYQVNHSSVLFLRKRRMWKNSFHECRY